MDGGELIWINDVSFDGGGDGHGYQDMGTNFDASPSFDSACAVRLGSFKFIVKAGGVTNAIYLEKCQFNNSRWGVWHVEGVQQVVRGASFETNWAVMTGGSHIHYEGCVGEGATTGPTQVGHMWLTSYPIPNQGQIGGVFKSL